MEVSATVQLILPQEQRTMLSISGAWPPLSNRSGDRSDRRGLQ